MAATPQQAQETSEQQQLYPSTSTVQPTNQPSNTSSATNGTSDTKFFKQPPTTFPMILPAGGVLPIISTPKTTTSTTDSSLPPSNARELASFCYKTGEDRRVQPMCFEQGEVLVLEEKYLGARKEACSKNQRLQITQKRDSKNVVTVLSVEVWLLTGDNKPRLEQDISSIFKFRCIEEQEDLFILVEKSGIPIVYGTRPPDRNKDPSALYVVRMSYKRPNTNTVEHVDFTLHKKQRSATTSVPKKRAREDNGLDSARETKEMKHYFANGDAKKDVEGDTSRLLAPQFPHAQTLPHHPSHLQQFHQFPGQFPIPANFQHPLFSPYLQLAQQHPQQQFAHLPQGYLHPLPLQMHPAHHLHPIPSNLVPLMSQAQAAQQTPTGASQSAQRIQE